MGSVNDAADWWWAVNDSSDQEWAGSMTPLTSGSGVNDTADQWWVVSMTLLTKYDTAYPWPSKFDMGCLLLMRIAIKKSYMGKLYYTTVYCIYNFYTQNLGVT
jgi:hypothetical protein